MKDNTRGNSRIDQKLISDLQNIVYYNVQNANLLSNERLEELVDSISSMCQTRENIIDIMGWILDGDGDTTVHMALHKAQEYAVELHPDEFEIIE